MIFRRIVVFLALVCGLVLSQIPEFAQQYRQRLGGALDELHTILNQFDSEALQEGLSRHQGIQKLENSLDRLVQGRGQSLETIETREAKLSRQLEDLSNGKSVSRLLALGSAIDSDVAARALRSYEPAVPVTSEGFVIGFGGFVVGWLLIHAIAWPLRRRGKFRRPAPAATSRDATSV